MPVIDPDLYKFIIPYSDRVPAEAIREALECGFDGIWSTSFDGGIDECSYHDKISDPQRYPTERALDKFISSSDGYLNIYTEHTDFLLRNRSFYDWGLPEIEGIGLFWYRVHFRDVLSPDEDGTAVLNEVIESVTHVYKHFPSPFAFSQLPYQHEHETTVTKQHLEKPELPDVYWLMILSPPICEDIGRERLQSAPVWRVDTLSDGSMRLVASGDGLKYRPEDKQELRDHLGIPRD
ncbi:hypothetical protein [Halorhabdus sp. BNX81]|uniref:hypothetical protein n=1 Tax=Halorhabdus sp. BNX81 TaxID=2980181 RepID=UPI0023DD3E51|nr:hypothetical protein [Halorhabdus sp. BNX81]WEL20119.1 Uncharacterized protein HBNXHr_0040 [Halorhabdus sp. BNX81]